MSRFTVRPISRAVGGMNCHRPAAPTQLTASGSNQLSMMGRYARLAGKPCSASSASTIPRYRPILAREVRKRPASRPWKDWIHSWISASSSGSWAQGESRIGSRARGAGSDSSAGGSGVSSGVGTGRTVSSGGCGTGAGAGASVGPGPATWEQPARKIMRAAEGAHRGRNSLILFISCLGWEIGPGGCPKPLPLPNQR